MNKHKLTLIVVLLAFAFSRSLKAEPIQEEPPPLAENDTVLHCMVGTLVSAPFRMAHHIADGLRIVAIGVTQPIADLNDVLRGTTPVSTAPER
ncbi:MAG: hypothetical protein GKR94_28450 [Gammaproteobacteria bacterium]|nr:hypothetical protein [Gammaproteobacteria bacterium]